MMQKPKPQSFIVSTLVEVALFFGVSRRTVADWRNKGMPGKDHEWPLNAIAQWLHQKDAPSGPVRSRGERVEEARALKAVADAILSEARAREEISTLVDRQTAQSAWEVASAFVEERLRALPADLAKVIPLTLPADPVARAVFGQNYRSNIHRALEERMEETLTEMAKWRPTAPSVRGAGTQTKRRQNRI